MSAFMVDPEHITVMVWAATELASPEDTGPVFTYISNDGEMVRVSSMDRESMTRAGQMLADANADSIRARYDEDQSYTYTYTQPTFTGWTQTDVLSAIACYEYQACETGEFEDSEAGYFCNALRKGLIRRLPGYEQAPWEIIPGEPLTHAAT